MFWSFVFEFDLILNILQLNKELAFPIIMEQYGNTSTYNLESVLVQNIKNSHYYIKKALDLDSVHEVIDEIYET